MSSATMRCETFALEPLPDTRPRTDAVTSDSGVYRVASRRGYDARNVLAVLRVNVDFVRSMLRDAASPRVADALEEIATAADRLDALVADDGR